MTTNKIEVVAYQTSEGVYPSESLAQLCRSTGETPDELIRLSDYEALQAECEKLRKDAEIGKIVWKFIDRMNDICPQFDPADRIISEFIEKVNPIIDEAIQESKPCSLSS